jgi:hypothetical protein
MMISSGWILIGVFAVGSLVASGNLVLAADFRGVFSTGGFLVDEDFVGIDLAVTVFFSSFCSSVFFAPNVFAANVFAPNVFAVGSLPGFFGDSVFWDAVFGAEGFLGLVLGDLSGLLAAIAFFIVSLACLGFSLGFFAGLDFPAGFLDLVGWLPGDLEAFFLAEGCLSLGKGTGISGANAIEERDLGGEPKGRF